MVRPTEAQSHGGTTSDRALRALIGRAERTYRKCWLFFEKIRWGREFPDHDLWRTFQPDLADALYALSRAYQALEAEKRHLVERKSRVPADRFRARMARLASKQKLIRRTVNIGYTLGDGFAWIFYQGENRLVEKHAAHPKANLPTAGLGGRGEIEFIRNVTSMNGCFVLYHGITSFLRIGDVSLVALKPTFCVVALGELKTKPGGVPGLLKITLQIVSPAPWPKAGATTSGSATLIASRDDDRAALGSASAQDRLKRQVRRMRETLGAGRIKPLVNRDVTASSLLQVVEDKSRDMHPAQTRSFAVEPSHGVLCYRHRARSILGREAEQPDLASGASGDALTKVVLETADPLDRSRNAIHLCGVGQLGEWGESFLLGTLPVVWWAAGRAFLRRLIFGELVVTSILNSARFARELEKSGFAITLERDSGEYRVSQVLKDHRLELGSTQYFLLLLQFSLATHDFVLELIRGLRDEAVKLSQALPSNTPALRLDLSIAPRSGHRASSKA